MRLWLRDKAKAAGKAGLSATRVPGLWTEDNPGSGTLKEMGIKKLSKFLYACDDIVCISRPVDTYGNETTDDLRIFPLASVTTVLHENQDVSFIEQQLDEVQEQMVQLQDLVNGSQARIKMRNVELLDRAIGQKQMLRRETRVLTEHGHHPGISPLNDGILPGAVPQSDTVLFPLDLVDEDLLMCQC